MIVQSDYRMIVIRLTIIKKVNTNATETLPYIGRDCFSISATVKIDTNQSPFKESKEI